MVAPNDLSRELMTHGGKIVIVAGTVEEKDGKKFMAEPGSDKSGKGEY